MERNLNYIIPYHEFEACFNHLYFLLSIYVYVYDLVYVFCDICINVYDCKGEERNVLRDTIHKGIEMRLRK